jgi:predicted small secreted protein
MAQAVSRRPLTAETRVRTRVSPCGISDGQSGTGTGFSPSSSLSSVTIIPPLLSVLINHAGMNKMPVKGSSETVSPSRHEQQEQPRLIIRSSITFHVIRTANNLFRFLINQNVWTINHYIIIASQRSFYNVIRFFLTKLVLAA